jgi:hypothetical protein
MGKDQAKRRHGETRKGRTHALMGVLVSLVGFFWFAKKIGWIPVAAGGSAVFWPAIVMVIGLVIALGSRRP